MRDIVAHHYGSLDYGIVWNMSVSDIPEFYMCSEYQNKIIGGKKMGKEIVIAVNEEDSQIFKDFAEEYPDKMVYVERKAFVGITEVAEFMVEISPELIAALSAYFVAKMKFSKREIRLKKGEIELEIKNTDVTPEIVLQMLEKLEQKTKKK